MLAREATLRGGESPWRMRELSFCITVPPVLQLISQMVVLCSAFPNEGIRNSLVVFVFWYWAPENSLESEGQSKYGPYIWN